MMEGRSAPHSRHLAAASWNSIAMVITTRTAGPLARLPGNPAKRSGPMTMLRQREYHRVAPAHIRYSRRVLASIGPEPKTLIAGYLL